MKRKLTLNVDENLLSVAKRYAKSQGLSLSSLVECLLRDATGHHETSFASSWRGKFRPAECGDARYDSIKQETADIEEPRRLLRREGGQPPEPRDRLDIEGGEDSAS